ncbi:hypothetical protein ACLOJK_036901 [Asimina triloba]
MTIDNSPDPMLGWKSRFFFPKLTSKRDIWGVPDQWVDPLLELVSALAAGPSFAGFLQRKISSASVGLQRTLLWRSRCFFLEAERKARSSTEGDNLVESGPFSEGFSELPPLGGTSQVIGLEEEKEASSLREQVALLELNEAKLLFEREAALSEVARLWEELEVSRVKVTHLQASLREWVCEGSLVERDPFSEGFSELPPLKGTSQVTGLGEEKEASSLHEQVALLESREVELLSECEVALSEVEVTRLQASLQEGDVRSLAIAEYLRTNIHRRREELERSHYSQSGYVRAYWILPLYTRA